MCVCVWLGGEEGAARGRKKLSVHLATGRPRQPALFPSDRLAGRGHGAGGVCCTQWHAHLGLGGGGGASRAPGRARAALAPIGRSVRLSQPPLAPSLSPPSSQPPYKILPNADAVRARAAAAVAEVTAVLSVPDGDAVRVLRHFKW